jgi:transcription elongation factor B polypeptide 3
MTLEVLQITHIGKTVNRLKKVKGLIGEKSKALIVKWKQLLSSDDDRDKRLTKHKNDITSSSYNADIILPSSVDRLPEQSSPSSMINQRKRKGGGATIEDGEAISIGLSKKSRTQVYSGRSAGLKYVPSLFDMCMNILIDNIDAIDEVSGIPFFILEPVLSKSVM